MSSLELTLLYLLAAVLGVVACRSLKLPPWLEPSREAIEARVIPVELPEENNPQAAGLHCGACGGQTGEVNARALASLLNDEPTSESDILRPTVAPPAPLFVDRDAARGVALAAAPRAASSGRCRTRPVPPRRTAWRRQAAGAAGATGAAWP